MSALLSILTSGAFGSALGSLFQWLNRKTEIAAKKMEYDHAERMADLQNQQALALADKAKEQVVAAGRVFWGVLCLHSGIAGGYTELCYYRTVDARGSLPLHPERFIYSALGTPVT